jgi:ribosome maturation factor RimP
MTNEDKLISIVNPLIAPLGYEVVHLEIQSHRQKLLRLFIDFSDPAPGAGGIGIEDCVKVTRALDEPLDQHPDLVNVFQGTYELEVSSPGIDRPLRKEKDYERFSGQRAKIHVFRALTAEELGNSDYHSKNPKQKNFVGILAGVTPGKIRMKVESGKKAAEIAIPLTLISKANLEPEFDFGDSREESAKH